MSQWMKRKLLAWNETADASFSGKDYPEGDLLPVDRKPRFWYNTSAYALY